MPKTTKGARGRPGKTSKKTDEEDINADLPDVDDLWDADSVNENAGRIAKVYRSVLSWIRSHTGHDYDPDCNTCPIRVDKGGRKMRVWELDVGFDFCAKWKNPSKADDGTPYMTIKYYVTRARESDYGESRTLLKAQGWNLKEVGELEGEWFRWLGTSEEIDGSARVYRSGNRQGEEWVQWFPHEYIDESKYEEYGIEA